VVREAHACVWMAVCFWGLHEAQSFLCEAQACSPIYIVRICGSHSVTSSISILVVANFLSLIVKISLATYGTSFFVIKKLPPSITSHTCCMLHTSCLFACPLPHVILLHH
jgi:hypothetical protein